MARFPYQFPVQEIRQAISVLKPQFDVTECPELYVNFKEVRARETFNSLSVKLNIINDIFESTNDYSKILYTGHTGCGKSTELVILHHYLNNSDRFFSIYIDVNENLQMSSFEPEDLFILLITRLVEALKENGISIAISGLKKLADEWLEEDHEILKELEKKTENETGIELEAGFKFWNFLSLKSNLKTAFSYKSKTSEVIRKNIKQNRGDYIVIFNEILYQIKREIQSLYLGKEIIFILDGLEKLRQEKYDIYVQTFFRDAQLIQSLNSNLICCVPIDSIYDIHISGLVDGLYLRFILPLISVNENTRHLFRQIVSKRVDENKFFDEGVLDFCVDKSGGNPRQLIQIVAEALSYSQPNNFVVNREIAEKACSELGFDKRRVLTSTHFGLLKSKNYYDDADKNIIEMLFSLALLEYNGNTRKRLPNPLLLPFLKTDE